MSARVFKYFDIYEQIVIFVIRIFSAMFFFISFFNYKIIFGLKKVLLMVGSKYVNICFRPWFNCL